MKKLIIIGAGGLGRMTLEAALSLGYICAFVDDDTTLNDVCNTEVLGTIDKLPRYVGMFKYAICAIADNELREKYNQYASSLGFKIPNIIHPSAYVSPYVKIGYGNILFNNVCVQNSTKLGNGVVITANSEVHHDCEIGDYSFIYSCSAIHNSVKIGKKVRIGSTVSVSTGSKVPDGTIVENGQSL